jgi:hypothetical protein
MTKEKLLLKYKSAIIPQKTFEEIQIWLKNKYDVEEISLSEFTSTFIKHMKFNALHAITNKTQQLTPDDFKFVAYKLLDTEKNKFYNNILFIDGFTEKIVYIILERKTGYNLVNHSKIQLELTIAQGISQYDYENDTDVLLNYISCMDRLDKKEY